MHKQRKMYVFVLTSVFLALLAEDGEVVKQLLQYLCRSVLLRIQMGTYQT